MREQIKGQEKLFINNYAYLTQFLELQRFICMRTCIKFDIFNDTNFLLPSN